MAVPKKKLSGCAFIAVWTGLITFSLSCWAGLYFLVDTAL